MYKLDHIIKASNGTIRFIRLFRMFALNVLIRAKTHQVDYLVDCYEIYIAKN